MAEIELDCPECQATLRLDEAFAGGVARCSECGAMMTVPSLKGKGTKGSRSGRPSAPQGRAQRPSAPSASARTGSASASASRQAAASSSTGGDSDVEALAAALESASPEAPPQEDAPHHGDLQAGGHVSDEYDQAEDDVQAAEFDDELDPAAALAAAAGIQETAPVADTSYSPAEATGGPVDDPDQTQRLAPPPEEEQASAAPTPAPEVDADEAVQAPPAPATPSAPVPPAQVEAIREVRAVRAEPIRQVSGAQVIEPGRSHRGAASSSRADAVDNTVAARVTATALPSKRKKKGLSKATIVAMFITIILVAIGGGGFAIFMIVSGESTDPLNDTNSFAEGYNPLTQASPNFLSVPLKSRVSVVVDGFTKVDRKPELIEAIAKTFGTNTAVRFFVYTDFTETASESFPSKMRWLRGDDLTELREHIERNHTSFATDTEDMAVAFREALAEKPEQIVFFTDQLLAEDAVRAIEKRLASAGVPLNVVSTQTMATLKQFAEQTEGSYVTIKPDTIGKWLNAALAAAPKPSPKSDKSDKSSKGDDKSDKTPDDKSSKDGKDTKKSSSPDAKK